MEPSRRVFSPLRASCFVSLGGNLGPVEECFASARSALALLAVGETRCSAIYSGPAWGLQAQPDFLNQVLGFEARLGPLETLRALLRTEAAHGRIRSERWGPRTLDLDLLCHGETTCETNELILPHPRLRARRFVLEPWAEIAPDFELPGGQSVAQLLASCSDSSPLRRL